MALDQPAFCWSLPCASTCPGVPCDEPGEQITPIIREPYLVERESAVFLTQSVKGGVNLDRFGGAKVDQLVKG